MTSLMENYEFWPTETLPFDASLVRRNVAGTPFLSANSRQWRWLTEEEKASLKATKQENEDE